MCVICLFRGIRRSVCRFEFRIAFVTEFMAAVVLDESRGDKVGMHMGLWQQIFNQQPIAPAG